MTTKERSVAHSTFSIEKEYAAPLEKVFAAFSDPKKKRRWFADGEEAKVEAYIIEFREGGHEHVSVCWKSSFHRIGEMLGGRLTR